jgi:raffinose/stachyose/melibiose transport system permease protein
MTAQETTARFLPSRQTNWSKVYTLIFKYAILIILSFIIMGPVLTAVLGGMRTNGEFIARPLDLPRHGIQWEQYTAILKSDAFWTAAKNSTLITIGASSINIVLSCMMAFTFSRVKFRGRNILFNIISFGLLFPLVVAILPLFIQLRSLGMLNSLWGIILPLAAFGLPTSVVILRGFFMAIPKELEDAAYIDGANVFGFFWYILLPISRPAISAVVTLNIVSAWNEYFLPLLVVGASEKKWPLPLGVMQYQGQYGTDWARVMAYVTILIIPAVVFYLFTEKLIVTGLTGGELKG